MKSLLLYFLKAMHEKALDKYYDYQCSHPEWIQQNQWEKVVKWRKRIRRIEPSFPRSLREWIKK